MHIINKEHLIQTNNTTKTYYTHLKWVSRLSIPLQHGSNMPVTNLGNIQPSLVVYEYPSIIMCIDPKQR